jgi:O-antigen chain-terminating methyltransferase
VESAELIAILREVRERVRARNPQTSAGGTGIALPDLLPIVHARDAAMGKVAAIGTVNPRPGGPLNGLVQAWKRLLARVLDWHVREQVEFNRHLITCVEASIEALNENNRALTELATRVAAAEAVAEELKDIRNHWAEWRVEWERKLQQNEVQFLRSVADLQGGFQHRSTLMDANYRDALRAQHAAFTALMERSAQETQQRYWTDMEKVKSEYERVIHEELRIVRQRAASFRPVQAEEIRKPAQAAASAEPDFDYGRFAERFRGSEEYVKAGQHIYLPYFANCARVLDIGCGRGEFLEMMRAHNIPARGIDLSEESVALCRGKGLQAGVADLYEYLAGQPEGAFDGIFCSQVVEHLPPDRLPEMIRLAASRLSRNGVIAIETPNPECLAIFATHFYLDPTHQRPVPPQLLLFYLEEFGVGNIEVRRLSPAVESMPSLGSLPGDFREAFFGALDYAAIGRKL